MDTKDLVAYLDQFLRINEIRDASMNGLQVQGTSEVNKIGFAVDACVDSFKAAKEAGVDMLIVHHGLFWGEPLAVTGSHYLRMRALIEWDLNLYAAHLPLDAHPEVGNNAQLAQAMDLQIEYYFGEYSGTPIAVFARSDRKITAQELLQRAQKAIGDHVRLDAFGPDEFRNIGICSGAGASMLPEAKKIGIDAFITGEPRHGFYHFSKEESMHVLYGRHYDTETIGLKALADHLEDLFELDTEFFDIPTEI